MAAIRTRLRPAAIAALGLVPVPAGAQPPPVQVAPVVIAGDADRSIAEGVTVLIGMLGRSGFFATAPADPPLAATGCSLDDPERERCFAAAAREAAVPNLVFVIAEPAESGVHLTCVSIDSGQAQRAELSLEVASGASDQGAALQARHALSRCIIGALHAPPSA